MVVNKAIVKRVQQNHLLLLTEKNSMLETIHSYDLNKVISFYKVDEPFGGLSNMSGKHYHLHINDTLIRSSEALYQCLRFTSYPDIQREIIENKSPKGSKMISKKYRKEFTRGDFEIIKVELMYWCLRVKLCFHPVLFGELLEKTENKNIVEISKNDVFWGCVREKDNQETVTGRNVLGKLLMELRRYYMENKGKISLLKVSPPNIKDFTLLGNPIYEVNNLNINI